MPKATKLSELKPDPTNPNLGTERGAAMIEHSISEFGYLDPGVVDEDGYILHGNKRTAASKQLGADEAVIIEHDGTKPIYIRAKGYHLVEGTEEEQMRARLAALALNRTAQVSINFDATVTQDLEDRGVNLAPFFRETELPHFKNLRLEDKKSPKQEPEAEKFMVYISCETEMDQINAVEELSQLGYEVSVATI